MLEGLPLIAGMSFKVDANSTTLKACEEAEARGCLIKEDIFFLVNHRLGEKLAFLAHFADEYRMNMLGEDQFFYVSSPVKGCALCRRPDTPEGGELRGCRDCGNESRALYCSKDCQRRDFVRHLPACLRLQKDAELGKSRSCQVCGDLESEGGGALRKCSKCHCKQVKYCGKECQTVAWQAGHKRECKKLRGSHM
ncbi:hypothetical protein KFL_001100320 [Klebsormidium nitens]|uniref:MYND-type domain-containing protein n=1 Tax=Klebsormidium nitens TaxID=105231 RepID=A0A1Y1I2R3_KLENI|nr:hypothetical protein KFL_001100320 [Klebsormidium nitens]|eukprot:GAQ82418.1 hypothetical protein KFL_001100320 [Klebsormidium nitens]